MARHILGILIIVLVLEEMEEMVRVMLVAVLVEKLIKVWIGLFVFLERVQVRIMDYLVNLLGVKAMGL